MYSIVVTLVAAIFIYNTISLLEVSTVSVSKECLSLEEQIRTMSTDDVNKLMIVVAETLTENYRVATLEQFELEHVNHSNKLALEHMNDVLGVLVKSIGAMPTTTLASEF